MSYGFDTSITPGDVVCVDIDSVLADTPISGVVHLVKLLHAAGCDIHLTTTRPAASWEQTENWLNNEVELPWNVLWMRLPGDTTDSAERNADYVRRLKVIGQTVILFIGYRDAVSLAAAEDVPVLSPDPRGAA